VVFGALTAAVASGLLAVHPTEFGVKLAILSSLTVTCALVPLIEAGVRRWRARNAEPADGPGEGGTTSLRTRLAAAAATPATPAVIAVVLIALAAPVNTTRLADNPNLRLMEQGLSGERNPQ
jgi:cytochrome c oxidase assembly factor CtaG